MGVLFPEARKESSHTIALVLGVHILLVEFTVFIINDDLNLRD